MHKKLRIRQILNIWRLLPAYICVMSSESERKALIVDEMDYWKSCAKRSESGRFALFSGLILDLKEYRNLLHFRLRGGAEL